MACSAPEPDEPSVDSHDPARGSDEYGTFAAGGISIERMTFDQGVAVDVFADEHRIDGEDYRTKLVSNRNTYVRALWDVPESWTPRAIEARLGVHHPDGGVEYASKILDVDGPSNENWLEGAFAWYVPAQWIEDGLAVDVTLYEVDPAAATDLAPSARARVPASGALDIGISAAPREMDVLVISIEHAYEGGKDCGGAPEITDMMLADVEDRLLAINPIERLNLELREEVLVFDQPANNFGDILDALSALRETDGAPPWLYYYGVIELCDWGSDEGFGGQARVPNEITPEYAWKRVAVGTVSQSYGGMLNTFVHELGHTQGRPHVPCSGENYAVEDYPYRDAKIGSIGFDIVEWVLHPPTHHDYMSYCDPGWVGDYAFNAVLPTIETLTQWKVEGVSWNDEVHSLVGSIYPDGSENWWVVRGQPPIATDASAQLRFWTDDGEVTTVPARVAPHMVGEGIEVVAPLTVPIGELVDIERVGVPGEGNIDLGAITSPGAGARAGVNAH